MSLHNVLNIICEYNLDFTNIASLVETGYYFASEAEAAEFKNIFLYRIKNWEMENWLWKREIFW